MSTQPWKCALVTSSSGGLGKAFARSLISRGKKVYIAGRTESNLLQTTKDIGAAGYFLVDVSDLASLPAFTENVIKEVLELDCIINNAGIQYIRNFPKGANLHSVNEEITVNVTSLVNLCVLFVPHLMQKEHACIMNIGSGLGYIPASQFPIYCATAKAFVKSFTLSLREQLRSTNVKVLEISPPLVSSGNLTRSYRSPGMAIPEELKGLFEKTKLVPLTEEEWMAAVEKGWDEGREEIGAGSSQVGIDKRRETFGPTYALMTGY